MDKCCAVGEAGKQAAAVMACPESGTRSKRVELLTVRALVRHLPLEMPLAEYYYCDAPQCDVVYFAAEPGAPVFRRRDLLVPVGSQEEGEAAPVCYCFGFTKGDIVQEAAVGTPNSIAERIKREVQAGRCACEMKNPSGRCCLGDVARVARAARRPAI